jgi:hypothetical protein
MVKRRKLPLDLRAFSTQAHHRALSTSAPSLNSPRYSISQTLTCIRSDLLFKEFRLGQIDCLILRGDPVGKLLRHAR